MVRVELSACWLAHAPADKQTTNNIEGSIKANDEKKRTKEAN